MLNRILIILSVILLASCSIKKKQQLPRRWEKNPKAAELVKYLEYRNSNIKYVNAKADGEIYLNGKKNNFNVTLKLVKDSAAWISISPALGIEVARLWLTPDSVTLMNKIDKYYSSSNYNDLSERIGAEIDFNDFQDLILNRLVKHSKDNKYDLHELNDSYLLKKQISSKLKRSLGLKGVNLKKEEVDLLDSNLTVNTEKRAGKKVVKRDKQLFIKSEVRKEGVTLAQQVVLDLASQNELRINYGEDLIDLEKNDIAKEVSLSLLQNDTLVSNFSLDYSRFRINESDLSLRFKISSKYVKKEF